MIYTPAVDIYYYNFAVLIPREFRNKFAAQHLNNSRSEFEQRMNILLYYVLFLIYIHNVIDCVVFPEQNLSYCKSDHSQNLSAILILGPEAVTISSSILALCPEGIRELDIIESSKSSTRRISNSLWSNSRLSYLKQLRIRVHYLIIESDIGNEEQIPHIQHLSLKICGIRRIPLGFFRGLTELETVDLSSNLLTEVPPDLVIYTPRLTSCNLSKNNLTFLPKLMSTSVSLNDNLSIEVTDNPIVCDHCVNSWLSDRIKFINIPACIDPPKPCDPIISSRVKVEDYDSAPNTPILAVLRGQSLTINCTVNSYLTTDLFWICPIGVLPVPRNFGESHSTTYSYNVQPVLDETLLRVIRVSGSLSTLSIVNLRGHLSGDWFCVAKSVIDLAVSSPLKLEIRSSIYLHQLYIISLYYGFGAMVVLLLIGIIGGTIRYCSETHCMRRPQPPFNYRGKTFIGVIPVPGIDEESISDKQEDEQFASYDIDADSLQYMASGGLCRICSKPPSFWFCAYCKAVHFAQTVRQFSGSPPSSMFDFIPSGVLGADGEIRLSNARVANNQISRAPIAYPKSLEVHQPLMENSSEISSNSRPNEANSDEEHISCHIYIASGPCVIELQQSLPESGKSSIDNTRLLKEAVCCHKHRPGSADVKLVVSNEKLAEEYRDALANLARAVESPDPAHFRENLEAFRSRLRCDVGHGVKLLRGEFQGLRAMSARGVATLRTQSTAAAQRMRAGFSHGVEQVKGGMRSMAELCGASSTIGQTISVVSVYIDETDQIKKERFISNFVF